MDRITAHGQVATTTKSVNIDGVSIAIDTPILPSGSLLTSSSGDSTQIASSTTYHPFRDFQIEAIPYGKRAGAEVNSLPLATGGGELTYEMALRDFRTTTQNAQRIGSPTAQLFNRTVAGDAYLIHLPVDDAGGIVVLCEWLTTGGGHLWLVRATQISAGSSSDTQFQTNLSNLSLTSNQFSNAGTPAPTASTVKALGGTVLTSYSTPSTWSGVCDDNNYFPQVGQHAHPLSTGSTFQGIDACGPRPYFDGVPDILQRFYAGAWGEYEWECVELSMRVLYLVYGISPYGANGNTVVSNYSGTRLTKVSNGTAGSAPAVGDVFSQNSVSSNGHTSVVTGSNVNSGGNGTVTIMEQNNSASGTQTFNVSNWTVSSPQSVISWLHNPMQSSQAATEQATVARRPDGVTEDLFIRGTTSAGSLHGLHAATDAVGAVAAWEEMNSGGQLKGSPSGVWNSSGTVLDVFGIGLDNRVWHIDWNSSRGWGVWSQVPMSGGLGAAGGLATDSANLDRRSDGSMDVFIRGSTGQPQHGVLNSQGILQTWDTFGPAAAIVKGAPSGRWNSAGSRLDVFAIGSDDHPYHNAWGGTAWSGWGNPIIGTAAAASNELIMAVRRPAADNTLDLFLQGTDNGGYHYHMDEVGTYLSMDALGGSIKGAPDAKWNASLSRLDVFGVGGDNVIYKCGWNNDGGSWGWHGCWLPVGGGQQWA